MVKLALARKYPLLLLGLLLAVLPLQGCMYGDRIRQAGAPPAADNMVLVQNAMELYRSKTGVLPILNKDQDTPEYERYRIDFNKLKDAHILSEAPANAFEKGGSAVYVVVHTESSPQVKLLDLVSYQLAADLQRDADRYRSSHAGKIPAGEAVIPGYWTIGYKLLNRKEELVKSPFSMQRLHLLINSEGRVGIDYGPEILKAVQKRKVTPEPGTDLRELLLDEGLYVPAASFPYHWSGTAPLPGNS